MSWLDEELEDKVSVLTADATSDRFRREVVATQVIVTAYLEGERAGWRNAIEEVIDQAQSLRPTIRGTGNAVNLLKLRDQGPSEVK